jgi:superfamily I DNA and/or RNA helicase
VIVSKEAKEGGLNVSLFERLTEEGRELFSTLLTSFESPFFKTDVHSVMLNTQYRMHPDISEFPAHEFYDLALQDGTIDEVGNALPGLEPPMSTHLNNKIVRPSVVFVDHSGNESMKGRSRVNVMEAHLVASVVEDLLLVNRVRGVLRLLYKCLRS